jgi:PAS domain S-box-containing protein
LKLLLITLLSISGIITFLLAIYALFKRKNAFAKLFGLIFLSTSFYSIGYAFEISQNELSKMLFWSNFQYIGISFFPSLYIIFSLNYTGNKILQKKHLHILLIIISFMILGVKLTNNYHNLFYATTSVYNEGSFPVLIFTEGPWYWVNIIYLNTAFLTASLLFVKMFINAAPLYRRQSAIMLIGSGIPWLALILYISGVSPEGIDINPFFFSITGVVYALGLIRYDLIKTSPIARDTVFESMEDGIIVLNNLGRIIDANKSALTILGLTNNAIGNKDSTISPFWNEAKYASNFDKNIHKEIQIEKENKIDWYDFRCFPYQSNNKDQSGKIISLRNITKSKNLEKTIINSTKKLKNEISNVRALQAAMLPDFSSVKNFEIASIFMPLDELSGDFFDGYYIDDSIFQIILCDVVGHGITSSFFGMEIRSLFKAMSQPEIAPDELIKQVNNLLVEDFSSINYFATVAICHINIKTGEIKYSSAGHPASLLYRNIDGNITEIGYKSKPIGILEDIHFKLQKFYMKKNDTLLMYTDGLFEIYNATMKELYGEERVKKDFHYNINYPAKDILFSLIAGVENFTDEETKLEDDLTAICIKKR